MKLPVLVALTLTPLQSLACSSGAYYETNAHDSISLAYICATLLMLAIVMRVIRSAKMPYLAIFAAPIISMPALYEVSRWGNGDCGFGLYEIMEYTTAAFLLLATYELVFMVVWKRREISST